MTKNSKATRETVPPVIMNGSARYWDFEDAAGYVATPELLRAPFGRYLDGGFKK
jgi:hypothetical protein